MVKINKLKQELNRMINEESLLSDHKLVEVSQYLDKMLNDYMNEGDKSMIEKKKDYEFNFEKFIDLLTCAIYVIRESLIIDCNKAALEIFGYEKKEDIIGLMPYELSPTQQVDGSLSIIKVQQIIDNVVLNSENMVFQWMHKKKNGGVFLSNVLIYNNNGTIYVIITDISENNKLKDELIERDYLYQMLFENHNSVMLVINPETGEIIEANKAAIQYYGYSKDKILKMNINEINILNDEEVKYEMALALKENRNYFQFTHRLSNNTCREVEVHSFPVKIDNENMLFSIVYDIEDKMKQKLMFDKLLLASPYAVVVLDRNQRVVNINENFTNLFQYSLIEVEGKFIYDIVSSNGNSKQVEINNELIYEGKVIKMEGKRRCKDGILTDVEVIGYPVLYHQAVIGAYVIYIDISDKKSYEKQLQVFKKVLESNTEGVFITDNHGQIEWINKAFTEITGYEEDEILNKEISILYSNLQDQKYYNEIWSHIISYGEWKGEIWNKNKFGEIYSEWLSINSIKNEDGQITHYVGITKDLSEKKRIDKKILEFQQKDTLTGLYNRCYLIKEIDKLIDNYKVKKEKFSIIVIDIKDYKDIKDTLGHNLGDALLVKISNRISDLLSDCLISRIDDDEFAILSNKLSKQDLKHLAKLLLKKLNQPYQISSTVLYLNFNIGICRFPHDGYISEILMKAANVALYESKKNLDDRICFYSNEITKELEQKFYLANYLNGAITNNELFVCYQPIFNIKDDSIAGAEALLRWNSPILGNIPPEKFIPIAEKTGQILIIGEWVINEVCKQINLWQQKDIFNFPVSINVSVKQLELVDFSKTVLSILESNQINPEFIELEITESVSSGDINKIVKNINELKTSGMKISMDDFGTGFSSLGQLNIFELDKLKIDKIFITDLVLGLKRQNLVKSIIAMAKSLNLITVAEGIETCEQLYQLKGLGCNLGQGFLLSKPLSADDIELLLKQNVYKHKDYNSSLISR